MAGLITKLDYLQDLGIDCLWLMPIYASPLKDDGYDIADFRQIHPTIGTVADFEALTKAAHAIAAVLKIKAGTNEVISTLLLFVHRRLARFIGRVQSKNISCASR